MEGEGLGDLVMCGTVNVVRQRVDTKQVVPNEEFRILFMNCLSQGLETRSSVGEAASISFIVYNARGSSTSNGKHYRVLPQACLAWHYTTLLFGFNL